MAATPEMTAKRACRMAMQRPLKSELRQFRFQGAFIIMSDFTERQGEKPASLCWKEMLFEKHENEMTAGGIFFEKRYSHLLMVWGISPAAIQHRIGHKADAE